MSFVIWTARGPFHEWTHRAVMIRPSATASSIHLPPLVPTLYLRLPFCVSFGSRPPFPSFAPFLRRCTVRTFLSFRALIAAAVRRLWNLCMS